MDRYTCPSCGGRYNGKRCRHCLYEHFSEEIAHGNHTHQGEPLVIHAPARKPIPRKNPFDCPPKHRKKHPIAGFLVLLALINSLMPMLRDWGLELEAREEAAVALKPEPVVLPEDMVIFWQDADVTIFTNESAFSQPLEHFCLYVENHSDLSMTISAGDIRVNDVDIPMARLVCRAGPGEIGKGWLELPSVQTEPIQSLSLSLSAIQNGRLLFSTDEILILAEVQHG